MVRRLTSESVNGRAGCLNWACPDLWEPWVGNCPGRPGLARAIPLGAQGIHYPEAPTRTWPGRLLVYSSATTLIGLPVTGIQKAHHLEHRLLTQLHRGHRAQDYAKVGFLLLSGLE